MRVIRLLTLLAAGLLPASPAVLVTITLDTSSLVGHPAGDFSIEFQLNDGEGIGDGNNTAIIDNFLFGAGGPFGTPILTGGASGALTSSVTITDTSFFNVFSQTFTPGSVFSFDLNLSTNVVSGGFPDLFTFAILDSTGSPLPTAGFFDVFTAINIDSAIPTVEASGSDPNREPFAGGPALSIAAPSVAGVIGPVVPEPATVLIASLGLGFIALLHRIRR